MCHLTQGSAHSTKALASLAWLTDRIRSGWLREFVDEKWGMRSDDIQRPWRLTSNKLTDQLSPGVMLQLAAELSTNPSNGKRVPVEIKIECVWGRAFVSEVVVQEDFDVPWDRITILRPPPGRPNSEAQFWITQSYANTLTMAKELMPEDAWLNWVRLEGHLDCAFALAERVARAARVDQFRVDIFVREGHPDECIVNEDSLSSGGYYGGHMKSLALLWSEPYVTGEYLTSGGPDDLPIHLRDHNASNSMARGFPAGPQYTRPRPRHTYYDLLAFNV